MVAGAISVKSASSAPIVRVETYIRWRFVKLALHHFDGCHPRRGAGGFVSRVEPAMMTTKAASPARAFIVTPYAGSWHREAVTRATVAV